MKVIKNAVYSQFILTVKIKILNISNFLFHETLWHIIYFGNIIVKQIRKHLSIHEYVIRKMFLNADESKNLRMLYFIKVNNLSLEKCKFQSVG